MPKFNTVLAQEFEGALCKLRNGTRGVLAFSAACRNVGEDLVFIAQMLETCKAEVEEAKNELRALGQDPAKYY